MARVTSASPGALMVDIKLSASLDEPIEVCFEPISTTFNLDPGESIYLRLESADLAGLEIVHWSDSIAVWVNPYPGNYTVLGRDKEILDEL
ncbi:hypothetical protein ACIQOU_04360 [Streptomyces sp. NPDC091279]|uniref:hypothetical protein n=1 Tax=unclassified Streptomyces TaxID=2593676 RepID=UPI003830229A